MDPIIYLKSFYSYFRNTAEYLLNKTGVVLPLYSRFGNDKEAMKCECLINIFSPILTKFYPNIEKEFQSCISEIETYLKNEETILFKILQGGVKNNHLTYKDAECLNDYQNLTTKCALEYCKEIDKAFCQNTFYPLFFIYETYFDYEQIIMTLEEAKHTLENTNKKEIDYMLHKINMLKEKHNTIDYLGSLEIYKKNKDTKTTYIQKMLLILFIMEFFGKNSEEIVGFIFKNHINNITNLYKKRDELIKKLISINKSFAPKDRFKMKEKEKNNYLNLWKDKYKKFNTPNYLQFLGEDYLLSEIP